MLCMSKEMGCSTGPLGTRNVDFSDFAKRFDFLQRIHRTNMGKVFDSLADRTSLVPDVAAATLAQLASAGYIKRAELTKEGLHFIQAALWNSGYQTTWVDDLHDRAKLGEGAILLVPGCQHPGLRARRVRAAFHTTEALHSTSFVVTLAGRNPGWDTIRTPNEARAMAEVWSLLARQPKRNLFTHRVVLIATEEISDTTVANAQELFTREELFHAEQNTLYVASSTFHLVRLAAALEKSLPGSLQPRIRQIVLIGAEGIEAARDPLITSDVYLKQLFNAVFSHLLLSTVKRSVTDGATLARTA